MWPHGALGWNKRLRPLNIWSCLVEMPEGWLWTEEKKKVEIRDKSWDNALTEIGTSVLKTLFFLRRNSCHLIDLIRAFFNFFSGFIAPLQSFLGAWRATETLLKDPCFFFIATFLELRRNWLHGSSRIFHTFRTDRVWNFSSKFDENKNKSKSHHQNNCTLSRLKLLLLVMVQFH